MRLDDLGAMIDAIAGGCGASVERLHGGSAVGGGDAISRTAEDNRERCRQQLRAVAIKRLKEAMLEAPTTLRTSSLGSRCECEVQQLYRTVQVALPYG